MIFNPSVRRMGAGLALISMLVGCASFPSMTVTTTSPSDEAEVVAAPIRGGAPTRPQPTVIEIPAAGTRPSPAAVEATAEQIAAILPDEPIGAVSLPPQPLAQYLNTVFTEVLKAPYSLGPGVGARTETITVNAPATASKRIYARLLQASLRNYGLTLSVRAGAFFVTDEGAGGGLGQQAQIVRSRSSAATPLAARNVTQFFQLVALQADGVLEFVQRMTQPMGVTVASDSNANALLLTGSGRSVAQAVDLLRNLDAPAFAGAQVVRLEPVYWSAADFALALQSTLSAEGYIVSSDPLGPKAILILPLAATNQTLAFAADAQTMERVRYWARELDQPSSFGDQNATFVYDVRNTDATTIGQIVINAGTAQRTANGTTLGGAAGALGALLGQPGGAALQAGRGGAFGNAAAGRGGAQAQQFGQAGRAGGATAQQFGQAGRGGAQAQQFGQGRGGLQAQQLAGRGGAAANQAGGAVPGGGAITIDSAGNRILFTGTANQYGLVRNLLQQLDTPARQVRVEVVVAEVTLTDETRSGIDFFLTGESVLGGVFSGGTQATPGGASTIALNNTGLVGAFSRGNIRANINAFASNNKVNILSRPSVAVRSGGTATMNVGAEVPFIQQQQTPTGGTTTDVIQTVSYRQTGVILNVAPVIYGDDRVDLQISQEVSEPRDNSNPQIASPIFDSRTASTTLSLVDGQTAVIGGMIQDNFGKGNRGIPFIKDVPVLGQAFRTDTVTGRKTELVLLITPVIIHDPEEMSALALQATNSINDAFRNGRGGSYTLTPIHAGASFALDPPTPIVVQSTVTPNRSPAPAPAGQPVTIPAAPPAAAAAPAAAGR